MSRADDDKRFAELVVPCLGDAYALAHWLTGNQADAEDVVQEASIRAFRALSGFAGGNSRAWMLTIVRNTAYSWLAKNKRSMVVAVDDLEGVERVQNPAASGDTRTPETELIARADAAQLEAAIAALPLQFRETIVLRDIQGLDYREIAAVTAVPIGTVMSRLARGRRRLIDLIRTDEP